MSLNGRFPFLSALLWMTQAASQNPTSLACPDTVTWSWASRIRQSEPGEGFNTGQMEESESGWLSEWISWLTCVCVLSFTVKMSVRTFSPSGLLFYMANANQQDYAVLQVQNGRLLFSCDLGKGPASATLPIITISDGHWHSVSISCLQTNITTDEEYSWIWRMCVCVCVCRSGLNSTRDLW